MAITSFYTSDASLGDRKLKSPNGLIRLKILFNKVLLKKYKQMLLTSTRTRQMKPTVGFTLQITTICKNITDRWTSNCDRFCIISEVALKSPSPENRTSAKKVCIFPCSRLSIMKDWTTRTVTLHPGTLLENEPVGKRHSKLESGVHRSRWNGSSANYWEFEHWKKNKPQTTHTTANKHPPKQTNSTKHQPPKNPYTWLDEVAFEGAARRGVCTQHGKRQWWCLKERCPTVLHSSEAGGGRAASLHVFGSSPPLQRAESYRAECCQRTENHGR